MLFKQMTTGVKVSLRLLRQGSVYLHAVYAASLGVVVSETGNIKLHAGASTLVDG